MPGIEGREPEKPQNIVTKLMNRKKQNINKVQINVFLISYLESRVKTDHALILLNVSYSFQIFKKFKGYVLQQRSNEMKK